MTNVTCFRNHEGKYIGFNVEGHSGYADHGIDIVCAGMSMLTQSVAYGVETIIGAKVTKSIIPEKAKISVIISNRDDKFDKAQALLATMAGVAEGMAEQYPGYVSFQVLDGAVL